MSKTKLAKISVYWFCSILIIAILQVTVGSVPIFGQEEKSLPPGSGDPIVLGAVTSVRGDFRPDVAARPPVQKSQPNLEQVTAKSYLVYDGASKAVLLDKNGSSKLSIASLTKLMTAWVVYKYADLNDYLEVSAEDIFKISPTLGIKPNDEIQVLDLFNAMLVGSANDAALTLANHTAKITEKSFASLMNEEAKTLKMADSKFSNALGFDSINNYATARDLKLLVEATQKYSAFTSLGRRVDYAFSARQGDNYRIVATNKLVKTYEGIEAVKTGYTESARGSIIVKAEDSGKKIVIIVLGSQNREKDALILKEEVFKSFDWQ